MRPFRLAVFAAALGLVPGAIPLLAAQEVDHTQPRTPIPALAEADRAAAMPPSMAHAAADNAVHSYTLVNRAEAWNADGNTGLHWDAEGWIGGDINRLWWQTRGDGVDGHASAAELQALYGRSFSPRWDWVAGLRQELRPRTARSFIAVGLQGLAPQWFEISAMAYLGEGGRTAARISTEYTLRITNRLLLQPVLDVDVYGKDDPARGIGSGLSTIEAGLRLRYEITRRLGPYAGIAWERAFGDTAELRHAASDAAHYMRLVAGIRLWF